MKKCVTCDKNKDEESFHKSSKKKDGLQSNCKECNTLNSKKYYKNSNNVRKCYMAEYNKERRKKLSSLCNELKTENGCLSCGESHWSCLDFHHIKEEDKENDVSYFVRCKSVKKALDEIKKCIILCSNCHRKIHAKALILPEPKPYKSFDSFSKKMLEI